MIVLSVVLGVALIVLVVALLAIGHHDPDTQPTASTGYAAASQPITTASSQDSATTAPTSPAIASTTASVEPTLPVTQSDIDLSRVAGFDRVDEVAQLLDTYFTGINSHDVDRAVSVFAATGAINPNDPRQVAAFGRGISTSRDDEIVIRSIAPAEFDGEPGLAVRTTFRSRQAASLGPDNQTCTNWSLTEKLVSVDSGYQLLGSQDVRHSSC